MISIKENIHRDFDVHFETFEEAIIAPRGVFRAPMT